MSKKMWVIPSLGSCHPSTPVTPLLPLPVSRDDAHMDGVRGTQVLCSHREEPEHPREDTRSKAMISLAPFDGVAWGCHRAPWGDPTVSRH